MRALRPINANNAVVLGNAHKGTFVSFSVPVATFHAKATLSIFLRFEKQQFRNELLFVYAVVRFPLKEGVHETT